LKPPANRLRRSHQKGEHNKWAISPDSSDEIVSLEFETDFGLLIDLSGDPAN
jgi:hypothetical protein